MAKCGFSLSQMSGIPHSEFIHLAREVEDAGFSGIFIPEANIDEFLRGRRRDQARHDRHLDR